MPFLRFSLRHEGPFFRRVVFRELYVSDDLANQSVQVVSKARGVESDRS